MRIKRFLLLIFVLWGSVVFSQKEYAVRSVPNPKSSTSNGFISNPDKILRVDTEIRINNLADSLEKHNGVEVAIVAIHSIGNEDVKDFAVQLFEKWGIGKAGADNGLLILFVEDQRAITFETGYGLEGDLPDAVCKRIQMNDMIPYFKDGNYNDGMIAGLETVVNVLGEGEYEFTRAKKETSVLWGFVSAILPITILLWGGIFIVVCLGCFLHMSFLKEIDINDRTLSYSNLDSMSGNCLKFSLLSPPLLLVCLYFLIRKQNKRKAPLVCHKCGDMKECLNKEMKIEYLKEKNIFEEKIGASSYDVWFCKSCYNTTKFKYVRKKSKYSRCPKCRTLACVKSLDASGVSYRCEFCDHYYAAVNEIKKSEQPHAEQRSKEQPPRLPLLPRVRRPRSTPTINRPSGGSWSRGRSGGGGSTSNW